MLNCRAIPETAWHHAREALVFYFSRRHGITEAEDLAQETLTAILTREDYEFASEQDFLKVCYGFASRVLQSGRRNSRKHTGSELDPAFPAPDRGAYGLDERELAVMLDDVRQIGATQLSDKEWETINAASKSDGPGDRGQEASDNGNSFRVRLFRARKKLEQLTGWKKQK